MVKAQQQRRQEQRQQQQQQQQLQQQQGAHGQTQMQPPPFHLRVARRDAARELQSAAKIGQAIRGQRIRDMRDLEEARHEKQEWVTRTMEMLAAVVNTEDWSEHFNDWVAAILPEYAEFGMFVDLFEDEMRHRLGRLQAIIKALPEVPETGPLQRDRKAHHAAAYEEPAPATDDAIEAQADAAFADDATGDDAADARDAEQLETLYEPPKETTMPQMQQQQQQLQQQQQGTKQTVASSILHEPERQRMASSSSASLSSSSGNNGGGVSTPSSNTSSGGGGSSVNLAAGSQTRGALIVRTADEPAAQAIAQFLEKLNLTIRVIDRTAPTSDSTLIDQLNSQSGSRFVLMLVDANSAGISSGDDLFDLGCCVGRMGPDRVFALHRGGDGSTDRYGIAHVPIDETEGWLLLLARLLRKAGVSIDLNKLV